jgi:hypothetical protein
MISIQLAILPVLIFLALAAYIIYRTIKFVSRGPPKTLAVSRGTSENDESTSEDKNRQVVGMINCEYCGSIMSQNATVCPNCGAPRKE